MNIYKKLGVTLLMIALFTISGCNEDDPFGGNNPKSGYVALEVKNLIIDQSGILTIPVNLNTSTNPNGVNVSYTLETINGTLPSNFVDLSNGNATIKVGEIQGEIKLSIPNNNEGYSFRVKLTGTDDSDFSIGISDNSKVTSTDIVVSLNDTIEITIDENPDQGQVLTTIGNNFLEDSTFSLLSESVQGAMSIDATTGELTVLDRFAFDREVNPVLNATIQISLGSATLSKNVQINLNDVTIIWSGPMITFTKVDGADWTLEANQDRITDDVWITRQNRWSIFNIAQGDITSNIPCNNNDAPNGRQPLLTRWAWGNTSDLSSLTFTTFFGGFACRPGAGPVSSLTLNTDIVLEIYGEDIFIDMQWLSWSRGGRGGFSYMRSTLIP